MVKASLRSTDVTLVLAIQRLVLHFLAFDRFEVESAGGRPGERTGVEYFIRNIGALRLVEVRCRRTARRRREWAKLQFLVWLRSIQESCQEWEGAWNDAFSRAERRWVHSFEDDTVVPSKFMDESDEDRG